MRIELNFSINDLCREYSYSELMTAAFEIFNHISNCIESKNVDLSKSNDYNIYVSYQQSENGETGSLVYIINDDQNSIFALEKLFAKQTYYRKKLATLFVTKLQFKPETEIIMFCSNGGWYEYIVDELL